MSPLHKRDCKVSAPRATGACLEQLHHLALSTVFFVFFAMIYIQWIVVNKHITWVCPLKWGIYHDVHPVNCFQQLETSYILLWDCGLSLLGMSRHGHRLNGLDTAVLIDAIIPFCWSKTVSWSFLLKNDWITKNNIFLIFSYFKFAWRLKHLFSLVQSSKWIQLGHQIVSGRTRPPFLIAHVFDT
jgi:hypothetical protein